MEYISCIEDITKDDYANALKAMILVTINDMNWALSKIKIPPYEETINKMNGFYNSISSENLKKDISSLIEYSNKKYLNHIAQEEEMNNKFTIDKIINLISNGTDILQKTDGLLQMVHKRLELQTVVVHSIQDGGIKESDSKTMYEIFDCFLFSKYLRTEYTDRSIYPKIRKECIDAYNTIESKYGKEILLQYVDKEFLKVK